MSFVVLFIKTQILNNVIFFFFSEMSSATLSLIMEMGLSCSFFQSKERRLLWGRYRIQELEPAVPFPDFEIAYIVSWALGFWRCGYQGALMLKMSVLCHQTEIWG